MKARTFVPYLVAGFGVLVLVLTTIAFPGSAGYGYDFQAYDDAARRVLAGQSPYLADTAALYRTGAFEGLYLYPPPVAVGFLPLAAIPSDMATGVWFVLRLVLLGAGCALLPVSRSARLTTFGVACCSVPVLMDLNLGNVSILVFALTAFCWRAGTGVGWGVAVSVLVMLRPPLLSLLVIPIAEGRVRPLVAFAVAGFAWTVLSLPFVGVRAFTEYATLLTGLPDISGGEHNFSLKSVAVSAGLDPRVGSAMLVLGAAFAVAATAYAVRRRDRETAFAVAAVGTLLTAPFLHPHYLVMMIIPAALLFDRLSPAFCALPLVGWLPGTVLPVVVVLVLGLLLLPAVGRRHVAGLANEAPRVSFA